MTEVEVPRRFNYSLQTPTAFALLSPPSSATAFLCKDILARRVLINNMEGPNSARPQAAVCFQTWIT